MLAPLHLRHQSLSVPLMMAPVAGVCNIPFRILIGEYHCPHIFTEMVSSEALTRQVRKTQHYIDVSPEETIRPFVQLFGARPEVMAEAAHICAEEGFTLIDINMGCPVKKVLKSNSGVALMQTPDLASEIVAAMVAKVGHKADVTVKTRLGWNHEHTIVDFALKMEAAGAAMLTVHGRTRPQGFGGHADWNAIRPVVEALTIPVVVNGDIVDLATFQQAMAQSGCAGAMIAREGYSRPWIFMKILQSIGALSGAEQAPDVQAIMLRHLELLEQYLPVQAHALMRKHGAWYAKGLLGAAEFRRSLNECRNAAEIRRLIDDFFRHNAHAEAVPDHG